MWINHIQNYQDQGTNSLKTYFRVPDLKCLLQSSIRIHKNRTLTVASFRTWRSWASAPRTVPDYHSRHFKSGTLKQVNRIRREWDSNPRYPVKVHTLSKRAPSASRTSLHFYPVDFRKNIRNHRKKINSKLVGAIHKLPLLTLKYNQ